MKMWSFPSKWMWKLPRQDAGKLKISRHSLLYSLCSTEHKFFPSRLELLSFLVWCTVKQTEIYELQMVENVQVYSFHINSCVMQMNEIRNCKNTVHVTMIVQVWFIEFDLVYENAFLNKCKGMYNSRIISKNYSLFRWWRKNLEL